MSDPKPKELLQAKKFIDEGKTEEALKLIRKFQQSVWPFFNRQESDKALEIVLQSKDLFEKVGEERDFAANTLLLGWIYNQKGVSKVSLNYGTKSIELHRKLNLRQGLASSLYLVGTIHMSNYDFDLCIEYFNQALAINEILPIQKAIILSSLGNNYAIRGELKKAIDYSKQGLKFAEENSFLYLIPSFLWYLGSTYYFYGEPNKGKNYLKKGLIEAKKINDVYIIRSLD